MMTLDEFDAPRLTKAPTAHAVSMLSGATVQYLIYAVPAWKQAQAAYPFYLVLVNNRDNTVITEIGMKDYVWAIKRAAKMCEENLVAAIK